MTLDEILAEGERLEAAFCTAPSKTEAQHDLNDFYHEHGPRLLAVARAGVRCANDGCGCVHTEPDPDGIGVRILWCPDRWPGDTEQWCWSCQMRAAFDARKPDATAEACRLHRGTGAGLAVRMAMPEVEP